MNMVEHIVEVQKNSNSRFSNKRQRKAQSIKLVTIRQIRFHPARNSNNCEILHGAVKERFSYYRSELELPKRPAFVRGYRSNGNLQLSGIWAFHSAVSIYSAKNIRGNCSVSKLAIHASLCLEIYQIAPRHLSPSHSSVVQFLTFTGVPCRLLGTDCPLYPSSRPDTSYETAHVFRVLSRNSLQCSPLDYAY